MAKRDEISSTEQLLDLIRDDSSHEQVEFDRTAPRSMGPRLKGAFKYSVPFKKSISVGVDLGHDDIKLIKIHRISDQKFEMLDYARVPFEADISRENTQFYQFLRPVLENFCGSSKNPEIWCTICRRRLGPAG